MLIGLQVSFHSAMKHENDESNMVRCLQFVRIYSFMKEIKVYLRVSYIVVFFVLTKNDNLLKKLVIAIAKCQRARQKHNDDRTELCKY